MSSPTQRSLKLMRGRGFIADVVERWNPHARKRHDLFELLDILCVHKAAPLGHGVVGIQTTSISNVAVRRRKILEHPNTARLLRAGAVIVLHGWVKRGRFWSVREQEVALLDGVPYAKAPCEHRPRYDADGLLRDDK